MRVLIAYFSLTGQTELNGSVQDFTKGNTQIVAEKIYELAKKKSEIFRIEPLKSYPTDEEELKAVAMKEFEDHERPEFLNPPKDIKRYDHIILAYPNWHGTFPTAVVSFCQKYDFNKKTILPVCVSDGCGMFFSAEDIVLLFKNSKIKEGLEIKGDEVLNSDEEIEKWLKGNKII